jgi:hypothetical protein
LVRGPITKALGRIEQPLGEFTVVANVGDVTKNASIHPPSDTELATEFGDMTNIGGCSRREAIALVASRHGLSSKAVYSAVERAKKSVE